MDQKIVIDVRTLLDWKEMTWQLFASQMYSDELLRLWINCNGSFRVVHGNDIIYEGTQLTHAIEAWESV